MFVVKIKRLPVHDRAYVEKKQKECFKDFPCIVNLGYMFAIVYPDIDYVYLFKY